MTTDDDDDDDGNYDLCVDIDNLGNDTRSANEMHDVLNNDPEWTQNFLPIHVNQFTGPFGHMTPFLLGEALWLLSRASWV